MLSPFFDKKSFLALLFLTFAVLAGNYFTLDLFFGIFFVFGSIASLVALYLFGNTWGILIALVSSFPTILLWHHPYAAIIFTVEILFVALLHRQHQSILLLDMVYWLVVGMPLGFLLYTLLLHLDNTQVLLTVLKQAVNGIANALIANLLVAYLPLNQWFGFRQVNKKISLQDNILNLLICFLFLPLLLLTLLDSNRVANYLINEIKADIKLNTNFIIMQFRSWHQTYLEQINELVEATVKSNIKHSEKLQISTELIQQLSPEFYSISIEDSLKNQLAFSGNQNSADIKTANNLLR